LSSLVTVSFSTKTVLHGVSCNKYYQSVRGCIQKFPDWPPGARTANDIALCHSAQLYRCFVSQSSEFCRHSLLCCFSVSVYCCFVSSSTQSWNFWIRPRIYAHTYVSPKNKTYIFKSGDLGGSFPIQ